MMTDTVIPGVGKDARTLVGEDGTKQADLPYAFQHLDPQALFAMANVMYEGNKKYGPPVDNWRKIPVEDHLNHMISHAYAWLAGDRSDDHLSHMACRAMGALQVSLQQPKDDCNHPPKTVCDRCQRSSEHWLDVDVDVDPGHFDRVKTMAEWLKNNPCPTCQNGAAPQNVVGLVCGTCGRDYRMYKCNPQACPGESCTLDHPRNV